MPTETNIFYINNNVNLNPGEKIRVKLQCESVTNNNFTASLGTGSLSIVTVASQTGYATTVSPFFSGSGTPAANQIVFSAGVSEFYQSKYTYLPNPPSGSENSLYAGAVAYGGVDSNFVIRPFDILLLYLSNNSYVETKILNVDTNTGYLRLTLDINLSDTARNDIANESYKRMLILSRKPDETNVILNFSKRDGKTSYGFLVPENLNTDILNNIDVITREVKQKLINDQTIIDNITAGGGGGGTSF